MFFVDIVSKEDLIRLHKERELKLDFTPFMSEDSDRAIDKSDFEEKIETMSVTDAQLLNPEYLAMISAFFMVFYRNLKS